MKKMSQSEATARHREAHPEDETIRKARQRENDGILRFHIRRSRLYRIELPDSIDQESEAFRRILAAYDVEMKETVQTEVG